MFMFVCTLLYRLDKKLIEMERCHRLSSRWMPTDNEYLTVKHAFTMEKQEQVAEAMWASSMRQQFLLKLKAKYAGNFLM